MKRIDWGRLVPLGLDGKKLAGGLAAAAGASSLVSVCMFFSRLRAAQDLLYTRRGSRLVLIPGAVMEDYGNLLPGCFWALGLLALLTPVLALGLYLWHYQGGRSIYTMRRLPDRRELWRRCLTFPLLTLAACGVLALLLTLLYYGIYLWTTPSGCLMPGQWQKLWR